MSVTSISFRGTFKSFWDLNEVSKQSWYKMLTYEWVNPTFKMSLYRKQWKPLSVLPSVTHPLLTWCICMKEIGCMWYDAVDLYQVYVSLNRLFMWVWIGSYVSLNRLFTKWTEECTAPLLPTFFIQHARTRERTRKYTRVRTCSQPTRICI